MGWALKSSQGGKTRFSDKQRDYLTTKFQIQEETGRKASPAQVSQMVMTAKDASDNRMFSSSEFLTIQQITSSQTVLGLGQECKVELWLDCYISCYICLTKLNFSQIIKVDVLPCLNILF